MDITPHLLNDTVSTMNPYDPPTQQTNNRRVWFSLATTVLVLFGIVTTLSLANEARKQARRHRSTGNLHRLGLSIEAYEKKVKRTELNASVMTTR
jgi:hypothetical protein